MVFVLFKSSLDIEQDFFSQVHSFDTVVGVFDIRRPPDFQMRELDGLALNPCKGGLDKFRVGRQEDGFAAGYITRVIPPDVLDRFHFVVVA